MTDDSPGQAVLREILEVHRQGVETTRALSDRQQETSRAVTQLAADVSVVKDRLGDLGAIKDRLGELAALREAVARVEAAQASNKGLDVIEERLGDLGPLRDTVTKIEAQVAAEKEPVEKIPWPMWAIMVFLLVAVVTLAGVQITGNAEREPGTIPAEIVPKLPGTG